MSPPHAPDPLTLREVAAYPLPGMAIPGDFAFSADDRLLAFLWSPERTLTRDLYALDLGTGERRLLARPLGEGTTDANVAREEALRRERQRQRAQGITQFAWSPIGERLLIPLRGGLYVLDAPGAALRELVALGEPPAVDPQWSPNGAHIAFVRDAELYVAAAEGGAPRQVTFGAREQGQTHGLAEYIAQEEMHRQHGYWWSQDGAWLAFAEVDERHIPSYRIIHQGSDRTGPEAEETHHYPFAGAANATVRLGVIAASGGAPVWLDLGDADGYVARVDWGPDGSLYVQWENRAQTMLELRRYDPRTGKGKTLLRETSAVWINLHDMFRPLKGSEHEASGGFLWASERGGYQHLYLYDNSGRLIRQLTSGEWLVDGVAGVDEAQRIVYCTGTRDGPTDRHLYAVSFDGGAPRRLTAEPGMHAVTLDHGANCFVDVQHSLTTPPTVALRSCAHGAVLKAFDDAPDPRVAALDLQPPELVTLRSRDGVLLHGAVYRPPARFGPGPYRTVVSVYGGPHAQQVTNGWTMTAALRAQYLRRRGFLVFVLDNRGSARRGLAFEGAIRWRLGGVEVDDQVDGVRWLVEQSLADPARVGIYGWSYGGYMALMCLARAPETFSVAVAGAPVTHWDGYDSHYTERYMGTPEANPEGYRASSVMAHVAGMRGRLLLVHGQIDENVHFRHTARLLNALMAAGKRYDLLLFPDERHMPRRLADRVALEARIADYFEEHM